MSTIIPGGEEEGSGTDPSPSRQLLDEYHIKKKNFAIRAAVAGSLGKSHHFRLTIINLLSNPNANISFFLLSLKVDYY